MGGRIYTENGMSNNVCNVSESANLPSIQTFKISETIQACAGSLTIRETEILELLGRGLSVKSIARALAISPGTVKWHMKNVYWKLGATFRDDALSKARLQQIIQ